MGSAGGFAPAPEHMHPLISERSIDEPRPLKVIYIGAGVSGICAAIQFPRYVPNMELTIYDKNADVGGTWFENKYPGCACDIPAHSYQLSFESSLSWSKFYAGSEEILQYWRRVTEKYGLRKYMKLGHKCVEARWDEHSSKWHVKLQQVETGKIIKDVSDVFLTGIGALNDWKWPDIKGLKDFKAGKLMHSADWDPAFDLKGKTVAVIGAGSSGIQIVPTIQPMVTKMYYFVRGRTWIASTFGMDEVRARNNGQDGNFVYDETEKEAWRMNPESYIKMRKRLEVGMQGGYIITQKGSEAQARARAAFTNDMRARLAAKPTVASHLIPDFPPLCKRLTPGPGYLEALTEANVSVVTTSISHITSTGVVTTDGSHHPVEAIICATGFNTSYCPAFPILGRNGESLSQRWSTSGRPDTYLSTCTHNFPNFFQSLGPNGGVGNGNLIIIIETLTKYHAQILRKMATQNIRTVEPKARAVENFTGYCDSYFQRTVFSEECSSWYKTAPKDASPEAKKTGRVSALWPGSSMHAVKALGAPRWEDFELGFWEEGNEWAWFGDGWTVAEKEGDLDGLCYYLDGMGFVHEDLLAKEKVRVEGALVTGVNGEVEEEPQKGKGMMEDKFDTSLKVEPGSILSV